MLSNIENLYKKIFHIKEIEDSRLLQMLFYVISFSFFVTFNGWIQNNAISISNYLSGNNICPPYFQSCGEWYFFQALPYGYSQNYFYVTLFMILGYGVASAIKGHWVKAHFAILISFIWKCIWIFLLTYGLQGNFDYYDMVLAFVFLFIQNKEYFAKVSFVFLYFVASSIKIHEGWIFGNYFSSLFSGTPIFGDYGNFFWTNILIIMQMLGCWFLLSNNKILQKLSFLYFLIFHIYSGFIVLYRYIAISIPALVVLFGNIFPSKNDFNILSISKKTIFGYLFLLFILIGQLTAIIIPGDQKKTLEVNYYGLFMFEASHQCISTSKIIYKNGTYIEKNIENKIANNRCDPYQYLFKLQNICKADANSENKIEKINWTFDHSINGHSYERIVNEDNACSLVYKSFSHNSWVKLDGESEILDISVYKNGYLYKLDDNIKVPTSPYANENLLNIAEKFYFFIWFFVLFILFLTLFYKTLWVKSRK